eukprot:CAMPEP_0202835026 /NCGR_PEP_ID=MMETSP1389-20130828/34874_1 /ASSEMBLY_ACC=CAM_ASM_000865 /TAXON_ID=302021 /ORGANISM="Rhodomonas sp., Strain CCMP768" /LENGTH=165 /DNA_ID=CAMNT_0049510399 /DNA_START=41 /DNA_END=538 /DNA_ORIENTATION=-
MVRGGVCVCGVRGVGSEERVQQPLPRPREPPPILSLPAEFWEDLEAGDDEVGVRLTLTQRPLQPPPLLLRQKLRPRLPRLEAEGPRGVRGLAGANVQQHHTHRPPPRTHKVRPVHPFLFPLRGVGRLVQEVQQQALTCVFVHEASIPVIETVVVVVPCSKDLGGL